METLRSLILSPEAGHLVMTLLHSLWLGALVAGVLWLVLWTVKGPPQFRYLISLLALVAFVGTLFGTYSALEYLEDQSHVGLSKTGLPPVVPGNMTAGTTKETIGAPPPASTVRPPAAKAVQAPQDLTWHWQQVVFLIWCGGAVVMLVRMLILLGDVQCLRRRCVRLTDTALSTRLNDMKAGLGVSRRVVVGFSEKVLVPCTIGFLRPMIIVPPTLLELDVEDIEAILLHELMHIKRFDWLVNIVQMFLESLLFFNPALWWVSRQIRIEREAACDYGVVRQTQQPVQYAQLLLQFAKVGCKTTRDVAFAQETEGVLTDRIKRLVVPGYRAAVHPGIVPVLLTLAALAFCSLGAYRTTRATVRYFGRTMTPQQRVETVNALKEDYLQDRGLEPELPEDQWIHVRGHIATADDMPLPTRTGTCRDGSPHTWVDVSLLSRTSRGTSSGQVERDGSFSLKIKRPRFTVSVVCKGYAVKHIEMQAEPGELIEDLIVVLEKGYPATIVCMDPEGNPIPGAKIIGGFPSPPNYGSYSHSLKFTTDENGSFTLDNASEALVNLTCEAAGFVKSQKTKLHLQENELLAWILEPAPVSTIYIRDKATGEPIADAPVYVRGKKFHGSFDTDQKGQAYTDASGYAQLDSLVPHETYLVMIRPPGKQRQYFTIKAGESIDAEFEASKPIKGRILGDLSLLHRNKKGAFITRTNRYRVGNSSHGSTCGNHQVPVVVVSDQEATFSVEDYYGQTVELSAGIDNVSVKVDVDFRERLDDIVIHLDPIAESGPQRRVFIVFSGVVPEELSPEAGFKLNYKEPGKKYAEVHMIPIVNGSAEVAMVMPNYISWEPQVGTPVFFKSGNQHLKEDRDYRIEIPCTRAGSLYGTINVPLEHWYKSARVRIDFENRNQILKGGGHLENAYLHLNAEAQTKFMFSPLPLGGEYRVYFRCENVIVASDLVHLTKKQPLCEMQLPWPQQQRDLKGRMITPEGEPAENIRYRLMANVERENYAFDEQTSELDGRFSCIAVNADPKVQYRLRVQPERYPWFEYPLKNGAGLQVIDLKVGLPVQGVYQDYNGNPRPHDSFQVRVRSREIRQKRAGACTQTIQTDAQGRFQATLFDAEYDYSSYKLIKTDHGRKSWRSQGKTFRPVRDEGLVIVSDPH